MTNSSNILRLLASFILVVMAQILVFNHLQIFGIVNPYLYVVLIMTMPFGTPNGLLMVLGFVLGLIIDLFCDTPGMHAGATVLAAFVRPHILKLIATRDEYKTDSLPALYTYGNRWYLKYTVLMVSVHHIALFIAEQFDTIYFLPTLLRIVASIMATTLLIFVINFVIPINTQNER